MRLFDHVDHGPAPNGYRGLLFVPLGFELPAIEDYGRLLELASHHENAEPIRRRRDALARRKPALN